MFESAKDGGFTGNLRLRKRFPMRQCVFRQSFDGQQCTIHENCRRELLSIANRPLNVDRV